MKKNPLGVNKTIEKKKGHINFENPHVKSHYSYQAYKLVQNARCQKAQLANKRTASRINKLNYIIKTENAGLNLDDMKKNAQNIYRIILVRNKTFIPAKRYFVWRKIQERLSNCA